MDSDELRFGGLGRLVGKTGLKQLREASIMVVGVGGVGSWTVEALARSGVGRLILVDLDDVCVSNTNRQLHALKSTVGKQKIDVLRERCLDISPSTQVDVQHTFATQTTIPSLLELKPDVLVDAINPKTNVSLLIRAERQTLMWLQLVVQAVWRPNQSSGRRP